MSRSIFLMEKKEGIALIKVAMIEDDLDVARFHRLFLSKVAGFELIGEAHTLEQGIHLIQKQKPDLLLLDVFVGQENGLDVLKRIRAEDTNTDVILITSANDAKTVQTGSRYGVVDYLIKPFSFARFQEALNRYRASQLDANVSFTQQDVDRLLHKGGQRKVYALPKGIAKETAIRVLSCLIEADDWLAAAELEARTEISHVSLRKYMRYFEEEQLVEKELVYQSSGRPLQTYKASPEAALFLKASFI
ncbi:response regulator [Shouchella clausii]|nr:response regulator [Shouchella clausii]